MEYQQEVNRYCDVQNVDHWPYRQAIYATRYRINIIMKAIVTILFKWAALVIFVVASFFLCIILLIQ